MHIQNRLQCMQFNNGNIILQIILGTFHANCLNQRVSKQLHGLHFLILNYLSLWIKESTMALSNDVHTETVWHSNSAYQRMIHCFATMIQTETISYIELRGKFRSNLALLKNLFESFERSTALVYLIYFLIFPKISLILWIFW